MKRYLLTLTIVISGTLLISWGVAGHRTVAAVAEKHLLSNVSSVVAAYLGGQEMTEVSSWADEVRDQAEYKQTAPWHFLNLPLGLGHDAFVQFVEGLGNENIYTAILKAETTLKDDSANVTARQDALKFLIHFVGDAHQPMHVSRKEDKGGNTIQVRFDGKGTNLHSLWDSKLIEHEHLSDADLVAACDKATAEEINQWQSDSPMEWLWESYQISSQLYKETEANNNIDEAYYNKYIQVIHKRINQAGIRLAGELNRIFKDQHVKITKVTLAPPPPIKDNPVPPMPAELKDLSQLTGQYVIAKGKVFGLKDFGSMTLVNLGAAYPNQLATVVLKGEAKAHFGIDFIDGKTLTVVGIVSDYKGKPQIVVTDSKQLSLSTN
jgi:hypothetical protein